MYVSLSGSVLEAIWLQAYPKMSVGGAGNLGDFREGMIVVGLSG